MSEISEARQQLQAEDRHHVLAEIEALKERVAKLEQGARPDGK